MRIVQRIPWFHRIALLCCGVVIALLSVLPKADPARVQIALSAPTANSVELLTPPADALMSSPVAADTNNQIEASGTSLLTFVVAPGDTLSHLFDRARISPTILFRILASAPQDLERRLVRNLQPGNTMEFMLNDGQLQGFTLWTSPMEGIQADINDQLRIRDWEIFSREPIREVRWARGEIQSSLFFAGRDAGLSETMTMNLAQLFGWDIDFALDIRRGDEFAVLYEMQYLDDEFLGEGPILAATFTNQGRTFNAIRYTDETGRTSYYDEAGRSVRKAFLRTPVDIGRISSHFNPNRRHPLLNTIRAHRGTDYAAPTGTPIRSTGDGRVIEARTNGSFGRMVVIQHGERFRTLYAHMNDYAPGIRSGVNVRQGQVIGYVGMTGAATGPHLHYEFLVNGVHQDPVTVTLPDAEPINPTYRPDFMAHADMMLQHLESTRNQLVGAADLLP